MAMRKPILRNQQEQARPTHDYSPLSVATGSPFRHASARASYPVFLSLHDTLKLQLGWAWRGLTDASRWDVVVGLITRNVCFSSRPFSLVAYVYVMCSDAEVRANALKSCLLNGISLLSIYVFELLVHPLSRVEDRTDARNGLHRSVGLFYRVLWLLPVIGVSLYLNVRSLTCTHAYISPTFP